MRYSTLGKYLILVFLSLLSQSSAAQVRNSITTKDSIVLHNDSRPKIADIAWQFLAGEVAFNATSFALWGDGLYGASRSDNGMGIIGIVGSLVTVPFAIDFASNKLGLRSGSVGTSIAAAFGSIWLISFPLLGIFRPPTYFKNYLFLSLPIITISQLVYDLTIPGSN